MTRLTRYATTSLGTTVLILGLCLGIAACHPGQPLTQAQVLTILTDAGFGVQVGCVEQWLEPPVCDVAKRVLGDARAAAEQAQSGWQAAAKAVLVQEETRLKPDSKLWPYFDAAIALL
jgi:hypothetical protein